MSKPIKTEQTDTFDPLNSYLNADLGASLYVYIILSSLIQFTSA